MPHELFMPCEDALRKLVALTLLYSIVAIPSALAQNTSAASTAEDMAAEQAACREDAERFCGGNTIFIFEMENCLKRYRKQLSKACRQQLSPTDFRKYYREEAHPFDFLTE